MEEGGGGVKWSAKGLRGDGKIEERDTERWRAGGMWKTLLEQMDEREGGKKR